MRTVKLLVLGAFVGASLSIWAGCVDSSEAPPAPPGFEAGAFDGAGTPFDGAPSPDANASDASQDPPPVPLDASNDAPKGLSQLPGVELKAARQNHTATALKNGHVLVCGGYPGPQPACDDFDPVKNVVTAGPPMNVGRYSHAAVALPSGQVLVLGGTAGNTDAIRSAEIYDPVANKFTLVTNQMNVGRWGAAATLITAGANAGKVLIVGGYADASFDSGIPTDQAIDTAEIFDPGADPVHGTFTAISARMNVRRINAAIAALPQGGFLIAGGFNGQGGAPKPLDDAETLDAAMTAFTLAANKMAAPREIAMAFPLPNGQIFVLGGDYTVQSRPPAAADLFDPSARTFTSVPYPANRAFVGATLLRSGRVLVVGGVGDNGALGDAIVFDPGTKSFLTTPGTLAIPRGLSSATEMFDGRVLVAGGQGKVIVPTIDIFAE